MKSVANLKPNYTSCTSFSGSFNYSTSAINTDTYQYVVVDSSKKVEIISDSIGKYSIYDIANWFLSKQNMTHKKLQKLCYYAQAWCYALKGFRLANTDFEAWIHGPVSPALWEKFKNFGYNTIVMKGDFKSNIDIEDEKLLEDIWDTYGENSGNSLEALSHRELPWIEARKGYSPNERCSIVISPKTMAEYYKSIYCGE